MRSTLLAVDTIQALETATLDGKVVLLHGDIAADQLFPKSFTFLDVPEHRRIIELLETGRPAAVIGATGRGSGLAGSLYPYPLIEDGDFDIPNAYATDEMGAEIAARAGRTAEVRLLSRRFMVAARQLTAHRGPVGASRIIVIAHLDSKEDSPGAVDNATGVAALLAVAELLADYTGPYRVEILPMNGEDYYASSGEHLFVEDNEWRWQEVELALNMDAIGGRESGTAVSLYGCGDELEGAIRRVMGRHAGTSMGEQWYESDHSIVAMHGRPAVALTSTSFRELCASVTHTERDTLAVVDAAVVASAARFVADLIRSLPTARGPETA